MNNHDLLIHISEANHWPEVFANLRNYEALQPGGRVIVVMNGNAVFVVQGDNNWTHAMAEHAAAGIRFEICNRALMHSGIAPESLPSWLHIVPSAILALGEHQAAGFAYIKP